MLQVGTAREGKRWASDLEREGQPRRAPHRRREPGVRHPHPIQQPAGKRGDPTGRRLVHYLTTVRGDKGHRVGG